MIDLWTDTKHRDWWVDQDVRRLGAEEQRHSEEREMHSDERLDEVGWKIFRAAIRLGMQPHEAAQLGLDGTLRQRELVFKDLWSRWDRHTALEFRTKGWDRPATEVEPTERLAFWQQELVKPEFVYFVQLGDDGPIKIGRAGEPRKRLSALQVGNPTELVLRDVVPGDLVLEKALHQRFEPARIRGEWFGAEFLALIRVYAESIAQAAVASFDGNNVPVILGSMVRKPREVEEIRKRIESLWKEGHSQSEIPSLVGVDNVEFQSHIIAMRKSTIYQLKPQRSAKPSHQTTFVQ